MRESNFCNPIQNRAVICITSSLYDRRALDCTEDLPLINSLNHLTYLTSTSSRVREILTQDGGLQRLVRILKTTMPTDRKSAWKWSLAFQCVVNVGIRGSEAVRVRVFQAGAVGVVLWLLSNFLQALEQVRQERQQERQHQLQYTIPNGNAWRTQPLLPLLLPHNPVALRENSAVEDQSVDAISSTTPTPANASPASSATAATTVTAADPASTLPTAERNANNAQPHLSPVIPTHIVGVGTIPAPSEQPEHAIGPHPMPFDPNSVMYREEDLILSLQLLAYLSKYPKLRNAFHTAYRPYNLFSIVERFTQRSHPPDVQYWAGVIMRNACRKDDTRGGIRKCANMACNQWERYQREFAKCRRCRKAKYCSKQCQSRAWSDGHRWWCVERPSSALAAGSNPGPANGAPSTGQVRDEERVGSTSHRFHASHHEVSTIVQPPDGAASGPFQARGLPESMDVDNALGGMVGQNTEESW
ncbi:uncharacterized protein VTP21DRAFT_11317 [Calcarisporiella thermophila]|uniref:uncharacterized protein n=1 Tax=Calcarisporiella thermophila TaxID=911321 RepID=UPI003743BE2B